MRSRRVLAAVVSITLVAAACGGDDGDDGTDDVASATTAGGAAADDADEDDSDDSDDSASDDGALTCGSLFSDAEIDDIFFGEANQLFESFDDSIGLLTCTWETTDEAEDDLSFIVLTTQVFTGSPVAAADFYDPTLFDDTVPVDDIGDEAFYSEAGGFYFLDDDIGGALSLTEVDVSSTDDISRPVEEVQALFSMFAERASELT